MSLRLYKIEKLCSNTAIELLFSQSAEPEGQGGAILAYPWRLVWRLNEGRPERLPANVAQFMIVVPKKRLRHAVDRVLMRRRCREAYRLHRDLLPHGLPLDLAFIYIGKPGWLAPYASTEHAIERLLRQIKI